MNKIRKIFSFFKSLSTPKMIGFVILTIFIILNLWYWLPAKTAVSIKKHQFIIAADNRWDPLDFHGKEQYMLGFASELVDFIAKEEEVKIQLVSMGSSQLLDNLEKGHYDGILSSIYPDVFNEKKYLFSEPFYLTGPVLVVPLNSKATSINELHTVGIERGFTTPGTPLISVIPFNNMNVALSELVMGKIDGVIMNNIDAYAFLEGYYSSKLKVVTAPLNDEGLRLITLNDFFGKALIKIFDDGLGKAKAEKVYHKLIQDWELTNPETAYLPK